MAEAISTATQKLFDELAPQANTKSATKELDKDAFLKLLTEQMKAQNPLDPSDSKDMAAQLAQFSSLEQLQNINAAMENQAASFSTLADSVVASTLPGTIGKTVKANTSNIHFDGSNKVNFGYSLESSAKSLKVEIKDASGKVVRTYEAPNIPTSKGESTISWDGKDSNGNLVGAGAYTFNMTGKDNSDTELTITPIVKGVVTGVRYKDSGTVMVLNGAEVPAGSIYEVM